MNKFLKLLIAVLSLGVILACNLGASVQPAPDTQVPTAVPSATNTPIPASATIPAPTLTDTPQPTYTSVPQTIPVTFQNVALAIPNGLGSGANSTTTQDVEMPPFVNPSNGPMPSHIALTINGYPLARTARITVFKAVDYASYTAYTQNVITALQSQSYQPGQPVPSDLTLGNLNAQAQPLGFQKGQGLRIVTQVSEGTVPVANDSIFYYFQGLTQDGQYYVSAILPVQASFLAATSGPDASLPAGGIQFPPYNNPSASMDDINNYYSAIQSKLNSASASDFTPSLTDLDALIQSIQITP